MSKLTYIDKQTKYAVYGWIREAERELKLSFVSEIIEICILYYDQGEIFDIIGRSVTLSQDKRCATQIIGRTLDGWQNNFGRIRIPSRCNIVCKWDLKIMKLKVGDDIKIGFCAESQDLYNNNEYRYTWWSDGDLFFNRKKYHDGDGVVTFKENDHISIILDLIHLQIKASVNNGEEKILFKNVEKEDNIEYKLMVAMEKEATVEILQFKQL